MHYLKLPTAIVHGPVTAKQDALEGLAKLRAEYRINDLQLKQNMQLKHRIK